MSWGPIVIPPVFDKFRLKVFFTTKKFNLPSQGVYLPIQKHTDKIVILEGDRGPKIADAVLTGTKGALIGIQVADCVPILLYDTKKEIAGAVHAGWRGTAEGILKKTISVMADRFSSSSSDILVAIGPSIKSCCYEVGHEVIEAVYKGNEGKVLGNHEDNAGEEIYFMKKGEKYYLDLPAANRLQAESLGVPSENIWLSDECTFCLPEKYYSYRFTKGTTGRQYGIIGIL